MTRMPSTWKFLRFCEVFDIKGGSQPPKSEFVSKPRPGYVRLLQIRDFDDDTKAVYIRDSKKWPKCTEGDIMIGRYGASVGKVLGGKAGAYNVAIVRLIFDDRKIYPGWARHFCKSSHFQDPLRAISRSAQNGFNKDDLKEIRFPFPPFDVQRRISDTLDALVLCSRAVRKELAKIPSLTQRYKQAVLTKAFSGALLAGRPNNWPRKSLHTLIAGIDAGKNVRCDERPPSARERGIVKVSSVSWGSFDPSASKTPPAQEALDPATVIRNGDFLISRANTLELVGACVVVDDLETNNLYLSDKVLRIRFTEPVEQWVLYFLRSPEGRHQIESLATGNQLSMRNISQSAFRSIRIPFPTAEIRSQTLAALKTALASITRSLNESLRAHDLLDRFDQATLARAFRGELIKLPGGNASSVEGPGP